MVACFRKRWASPPHAEIQDGHTLATIHALNEQETQARHAKQMADVHTHAKTRADRQVHTHTHTHSRLSVIYIFGRGERIIIINYNRAYVDFTRYLETVSPHT